MSMRKNDFWRMVAIIGSILVIIAFALCYFVVPQELKKVYLYVLIPVGVFLIYSVIHQLRFPLDLRIYVYWVFIFSFLTVSYGFSALSLFIFYCAYLLGQRIRFFRKAAIIKLTVASLCYVASALYQLRLNKQQLIDSFADFMMMLIALLAMHFIFQHLLKRIDRTAYEKSQKEDLAGYMEQMEFSDRDKEILKEVLDGCKYEEIAINHNLSLSSVKKRLAFLYKKLGVTCQIDFIVKFSNK